MKLISIVVPVYNEEDNIRHFYEAIREVMEKTIYDFELVFVDDGSKDTSRPILIELENEDSRVQPSSLETMVIRQPLPVDLTMLMVML